MIIAGELPAKPDSITTTQWRLIERMCSYGLTDRPSIADVVRELEAFTKYHFTDDEYAGLLSWPDIGDLHVADSTVSQFLTQIEAMCGGSMTIDQMNRAVYDRLADTFNQLEAQSGLPAMEVAQRYSEIVHYFHLRLKTTSAVGSVQAARFATSRQRTDDTFSVHNDIDVFIDTTNLSRAPEVHQWRDRWEQQRRQQQHEILERLEDLLTLFEDVGDDQKREEALTYLRFELSKHPTSYATSKVADFTHAKATIAAMSMSTNPNWFIPAHEVTFDKFDEFSRGAFGKVYHGRWN
ncbi:hypothetical protein PHYPSEUDO_001485 [Phytophthora pseudosyringae]|uniref:Uncharacterized protein n=1 Tax=Phytophthora pseudosyringae TaxID=221518 RepID=A0A8T1VZR0_9STRA|nr:hypothetical protein PHYPSEUDO_001485 [Phytophthora pseudosyringae]